MIKVEHITKKFNDLVAVNDVSLEIKKGEIVSLIGPSGSGKSTVLRCIIGLEKPEEGKIFTLNSGTLSKILKIKKNTITKNFNARKYEYISPSKCIGNSPKNWSFRKVFQPHQNTEFSILFLNNVNDFCNDMFLRIDEYFETIISLSADYSKKPKQLLTNFKTLFGNNIYDILTKDCFKESMYSINEIIMKYMKLKMQADELMSNDIIDCFQKLFILFSPANGKYISLFQYFLFHTYFSFDDTFNQILGLTERINNEKVGFSKWFLPSFSNEQLIQLINEKPTLTWIVGISQEPGIFILLKKCVFLNRK